MTEFATKTQPDLPLDPASMDGLELLTAIAEGRLPAAPIGATLGMSRFEVLGRGSVAVELVPESRHYNPIGSVHGGVHSTLLDTVCGCAVHSTLAVGEGYTTLDLSVKFLRGVTVDSGRLRAVGSLLQRGRRTALAEGKLYDGQDRLVAHATSSCMIFS